MRTQIALIALVAGSSLGCSSEDCRHFDHPGVRAAETCYEIHTREELPVLCPQFVRARGPCSETAVACHLNGVIYLPGDDSDAVIAHEVLHHILNMQGLRGADAHHTWMRMHLCAGVAPPGPSQ